MCCLIACKTQKLNLETIKKIWGLNDDGAGIGWLEKGRAKYIKGLSSAEELFKLVEKTPLPHVVHFRLQSVGGFSNLLTHPFEVTRDSKLRLRGEAHRLLFHNGHDGDFKKYLSAANLHVKDNSPMSDTRALAMIVSNNNEKFLQIATGKFILIDATCGRFKTFGEFKELPEFKGILFSNDFWKYRTRVSSPVSVNSTANHYTVPAKAANSCHSQCDAMVSEGGQASTKEEYDQMSHEEKAKHWRAIFGSPNKSPAQKEYWLRIAESSIAANKKAQQTQDSLRLTNGAASELS